MSYPLSAADLRQRGSAADVNCNVILTSRRYAQHFSRRWRLNEVVRSFHEMTTSQSDVVVTEFAVNSDSFAEHGIAGPVSIFTPDESQALLERLRHANASPEWLKGRAAVSSEWFSVASDSRILDFVESLLGPNIMLWGASLVKRRPGQTHPWHTDIETSAPQSGTVSAWIGLRNTSRESSLKLVTRSQKFGITIQQRASDAGMRREEVTSEQALEWARELDSRANLVQFELSDGDAIFFDGRLWHGSHNAREDGVRFALLLQYAVSSRAMRIPDFHVLDFPFHFLDEPHPPCVMVRGRDEFRVNRIVEPPSPSRLP